MKKYKRTGRCNKCGLCCELALTYFHKYTVKSGEKRIKKIVPFGDGHRVCSSYSPKERKCLNHKTKPSICKEFPSSKRELYLFNKILKELNITTKDGIPVRCSYKFVKEVKE